MPPRKASATVHVTVRIKEPVRAAAERRARRRGVSLNQEIADCLELATVPELLSSGAFDLHDLARFSDFAKLAKRMTQLAGYPEDEWRDLAFDVNDGAAVVWLKKRLRDKADAELRELRAKIEGEGAPPKDTATRRSPAGTADPQTYLPIAERKAAKRRIAELESIRAAEIADFNKWTNEEDKR